MNYTVYPEYHSFPSYPPSDADFSHVVSSAPCYQQPQESDPARSLINFMVAASGNLEILLRKPRKSRRKVNLKKYIDRQLKRRLVKLKAMGKAPHELSSITLHTVLAAEEDDKNIGLGWLIDENDVYNDENEDEEKNDVSGPSRSMARCSRRQQARSSTQQRMRGGWKAAPIRARQSHQMTTQPQKFPQELQEQDMTKAFEQNIVNLLEEMGDDISENSDSGCLSEGSLYSHLPDSGSPVIEAATASGYSSNPLPPNPAVSHHIMLRQGEIMQHHQIGYCPQPLPSEQMIMHMHQQVWHGYANPRRPQLAAPSQDLPVQLANIPTEQLLPTAAW